METKISKELIKKAEELIGDDTGYIDSLETMIESARMSVYFEWIDKLCKNRMNSERLYYNLHLNYFETDYYLEKVIIFLESNDTKEISDVIIHLKSSTNQKQLRQ